MTDQLKHFVKTDKTSKNDMGDVVGPLVGAAVGIGMLGMMSKMLRNDEPRRYETKEEHKRRLENEKNNPPRRGLFGDDNRMF